MALPALIFYTSGNRVIFSDDTTNIVSMGGIYLGNDLDEIEVYIDEELVEKSRLFRRALYIEDIAAGIHRVHVQQADLQTWVKELPVYPHIVTETYSFNMPTVPQTRLIGRYLTDTGVAVVPISATTTGVFAHASITNAYIATSTTATSSWEINPEYTYVDELFKATSTTRSSLLSRMQAQLESSFRFSSATPTPQTTEATTTAVINRDIELAAIDGEIVATWLNEREDAPYYFCVRYDTASTTAERYGEHVARDVIAEVASSSLAVSEGERFCRRSIQIDRNQQDVYLYDFLPGSTDLVLLHLEDGLYVTEIDDRSWQNTQLLYPGEDIMVIVDDGQILVQDGPRYFEVLTTVDGE